MPAPAEQTDQSLATCERAHIESVLAICEGNAVLAAQVLGIHVSTLYRKIHDYKMHDFAKCDNKTPPAFGMTI